MACNNDANNKHTDNTTTKDTPQSKLNDVGTKKLMTVMADYYELKDAFVAIDVNKADKANEKLIHDIDTLKAFLLTDTANSKALLPYMDSLHEKTTFPHHENIEPIKDNFSKISDLMYALLKKVALTHAGVYREFCPMAFDDKGGFWLSNESEIRNPYFGKKMLECGEVTDSLK
jgi:Cu(I)/Ag(I) efflux system membrane fusion protein